MKNRDISSLFRKAGRKVKKWDVENGGPFKEQFIKIHKGWGDPDVWRTIQTYSPKLTNGYFLNAADMQKGADGAEWRPENEQIYWTLFIRTMIMSLAITCSCIILGYPVAWILANLPARTANLLMILVLLPFWTSLLVRTSAWKVMLQQQGCDLNETLVWLGLVADDARLVMINNQFGYDCCDDPHPAAVHDPADVFGDADHQTDLPAGGQIAGRDQLDRVLAGVFPAVRAGYRRRFDPRVHPGHRLLHHA